MAIDFFTTILNLAVPITAAILLACLGEIISERAGVLNLGIEGAMAVGALTGVATAGVTGNYWLGFAAGMVAGGLLSLLLGFFLISLKSDPIITGVMITLLGIATTTFFGQAWSGADIPTFEPVPIPILADIPIIGVALFQSDPPVYFACLMVPMVWYFLFKTNLGMEIIATGDDPRTADTMGINVFKIKYLAVFIGGLLAGAGGVMISLSFSNLWTAGLIDGRGWVAVALVIFARWRPFPALAGASLFGFIFAAQFPVQGITPSEILPLGTALGPLYDFLFHPTIMGTYPFLFTIAILAVATIREEGAVAMPQELLEPYIRES